MVGIVGASEEETLRLNFKQETTYSDVYSV